MYSLTPKSNVLKACKSIIYLFFRWRHFITIFDAKFINILIFYSILGLIHFLIEHPKDWHFPKFFSKRLCALAHKFNKFIENNKQLMKWPWQIFFALYITCFDASFISLKQKNCSATKTVTHLSISRHHQRV